MGRLRRRVLRDADGVALWTFLAPTLAAHLVYGYVMGGAYDYFAHPVEWTVEVRYRPRAAWGRGDGATLARPTSTL